MGGAGAGVGDGGGGGSVGGEEVGVQIAMVRTALPVLDRSEGSRFCCCCSSSFGCVCVCVCVCVRACVRACVCIFHIVLLEPLLMSTLCVSFC